MNHLFRISFVAILTVCCSLSSVFAQQMPPIPVDPNVRIGKLENGLTYYIRKNSLPENRAEFYIAQKVGSIQENDDQKGLAHFLEHMCFNGTTHYPGDALKQYLETIGVKFGENLNAYTSIDETVYNISNVPVIREGVIDSCLLILHDWSNDLTLDVVEIDKERGVIHEEWRSRMSASQRMMEKALPVMFAGTQYEDCLPIGKMDVVLNFKPQVLRDYYEKWYRPDLQGIVVVGDIDVDMVEAKIKKMFSDIPAQPDAAERVYYPVTDNKEPIVVIEQDKEQANIQILFFNKHETVPTEEKGNMGYMVAQYMTNLISNMISARLDELRQSANPPFVYAGAYDSDFFIAKTKDAFTGYVICKEEAIETGFETLAREIERVRRFGFTESEYTRARADYLRQLESSFNEKDKLKNNQIVRNYVRHFLDNEPIPGIENEYAIMNQIAPMIPVAALNQAVQGMIGEENKVVALFAPAKEGLTLPTKEALINVLNKISAEELTPYEDKVSDEPLISQEPTPGKIVSEKKDDIFGTTTLTLSNGVKVIVKDTDFKADEIMMRGVSEGGTSLFPESEIENIKTLNAVISAGGFGNFNPVDMEKVLAGKKASVRSSISTDTEMLYGSCSPKDFETMMQLTYLTFTSPRKDQDAFESYKTRTKAQLQNQELQPMVTFIDSINSTIYNNHPRSTRLSSGMIDKVNYDRVIEMYKDRFADASDFTFVFIGNIDMETAKPLFEMYLGSLPSINRKETFADTKMDLRQGMYKNEFIKEQETAKVSSFVFYNGKCDYNQKNRVLMDITRQILTLIYTEKVREDEGGTYGVSVNGGLEKDPKETFYLQIMFETSPSKKDKLMEIIFAEMDNLMNAGPSELNLNKTKEFMIKKHQENLKENSYWLSTINEYVLNGVNMETGYEEIVNGATVGDIQKFAKSLFGQNNRSEVLMISPEKE
ncbi:insulinase family protein [Bacteroides sp. 214]|uniref:M16 family metallopeptidase n=1 Tax=Bacteroides sp. 214 TaxID=2302935 RepID=UPI0013D66114|nr:insulinase family protein [Bacteroides sp. 214]NDW13157.1 insulinase family protein [Bacteroides sp. 214]